MNVEKNKDLLVQASLYGGKLLLISHPDLIERYNVCLDKMGIERTELAQFHIDGAGWSPEIADEKSDMFYLCHTDANPHIIIISISQEKLPIYVPAHSFDRHLMREVFSKFKRQIAFLTTRTGIYFSLDQGITRYENPHDLLMIDMFKPQPFTDGDLLGEAEKQRDFVSFLRKENNWTNMHVAADLSDSVRTFGNLTDKNLSIEPIPYTDVQSMYVRAFGGVYLFREEIGMSNDPVLIVCDPDTDTDGANVYHLKDKTEILQRLEKEGLLGYHTSALDSKKIRRILDAMIDNTIIDHDPDADIFTMTHSVRIGKFNKCATKKQLKMLQLEKLIRFYEKANDEAAEFDFATISEKMRIHLLRPDPVLRNSRPILFDLLMQLLTDVIVMPIEVIHAYHKALFFKRASKWTESECKHAIRLVLDNPIKKELRKQFD